MKKLALTVVGLLVLGATVAMADGSKVSASENANLNIVNKSEVEGSTVGMKIEADGSKVQADRNLNLDIVNKSVVKDSTIGMEVDAK